MTDQDMAFEDKIALFDATESMLVETLEGYLSLFKEKYHVNGEVWSKDVAWGIRFFYNGLHAKNPNDESVFHDLSETKSLSMQELAFSVNLLPALENELKRLTIEFQEQLEKSLLVCLRWERRQKGLPEEEPPPPTPAPTSDDSGFSEDEPDEVTLEAPAPVEAQEPDLDPIEAGINRALRQREEEARRAAEPKIDMSLDEEMEGEPDPSGQTDGPIENPFDEEKVQGFVEGSPDSSEHERTTDEQSSEE